MTRWPTIAAAALALAACTATETTPDAAGTAPVAGNAAMTAPAPEPDPTRTPASGAPTQAAPVASETERDSCGASKARARWTGVLPSAEAKAGIAKAVGDRPIRYYTQGDPITMDYSEDRLNVVLGRDGRIAEFRCG